MDRFVFTCGDINGIGPEIVLKTLNKIHRNKNSAFIFVCPENVFGEITRIVKPEFKFEITRNFRAASLNTVTVISYGKPGMKNGSPTKQSGEAAFNSIEIAAKLVIDKKAEAVVTAPISKEAVNSAGHNFPGHTEMFAKWCGKKNFVMTFLSAKMNAALATIHEPLQRVPKILTIGILKNELKILSNTLAADLNIKSPRIAVLGLNPHAGEKGLIGSEEEKIIRPAITSFKSGTLVEGPFSPDAFFANSLFKKYDLVFGMYHDQVLIPFKMLNFGAGVNYTAGLPIVRTSPDHGTAFDIAWKNKASESSMLQAYRYAKLIVNNRRKYIDG